MNEVIYVETISLPTPIVKKDKDALILVFPKTSLDWGRRGCGARHYFYVTSPFKIRGAIKIGRELYEKKILPVISEKITAPESFDDLVKLSEDDLKSISKWILRTYYRYLRFKKISDDEYKATPEPATHYIIHVKHKISSRVNPIVLEAYGNIEILREWSTACAIDEVASILVKAPIDTEFYVLKNTGVYRGKDDYYIEKYWFETDRKKDNFGINVKKVYQSIPSLEDARNIVKTLLGSDEDEIVEIEM